MEERTIEEKRGDARRILIEKLDAGMSLEDVLDGETRHGRN